MYKLLIVDDEPRQVRALANIINQMRPEYEVFTASDGQEALDFITNHSVDILFTDIRMPNIDGLQLLEKLTDLGLLLRIVILSGYGEFEYAQKAIRFGVNDYIVKPISKADLENILINIESSIKEERDAETQEENLKKKLDNSLPVYLEHQLNKWVTGRINEKDLDEIESIFPYKRFGIVLITAFSKIQYLPEDLNAEFMQYAKFSIKEALKTLGHTISFFLETNRNFMVTILVSNRQFNQLANDHLKRLNQYIKNVKDEFNITATIGIGERSENIFEDIVESIDKAQAAIEHRFFLGLEKIIFYSSINPFSGTISFNINAVENEISGTVRRKDKVMISKITSDIFGSIHHQCNIRPNQFKEDLLYLLLNQAKNICNLMEEERYYSLIAEIKIKTLRCEVYRELWHFTNEILCEMIDISDNNANDKNGVIINKCKKYIDEKYMEDISLEAIAQKYYFNPSYFSNLFKNHTGLGFSEYLLKVRILNAKNLLKYTQDSMADVAGKVGFRDPTYFNRMFKREVGISPLKYRQMNEK